MWSSVDRSSPVWGLSVLPPFQTLRLSICLLAFGLRDRQVCWNIFCTAFPSSGDLLPGRSRCVDALTSRTSAESPVDKVEALVRNDDRRILHASCSGPPLPDPEGPPSPSQRVCTSPTLLREPGFPPWWSSLSRLLLPVDPEHFYRFRAARISVCPASHGDLSRHRIPDGRSVLGLLWFRRLVSDKVNVNCPFFFPPRCAPTSCAPFSSPLEEDVLRVFAAL